MFDEYDYAGQRAGAYVSPRPEDVGGVYVTNSGWPHPDRRQCPGGPGPFHPRQRDVYAPGYRNQGYLAPDQRGALHKEGFGASPRPEAPADPSTQYWQGYGPRYPSGFRGLASRRPRLAALYEHDYDPRQMLWGPLTPKEGFGTTDTMVIYVLLFVIFVLTAMLIARPTQQPVLLLTSPGGAGA